MSTMARSQYDLFEAIDGMTDRQMVDALINSGDVDSWQEGRCFLEDCGMLKDDGSLDYLIRHEAQAARRRP